MAKKSLQNGNRKLLAAVMVMMALGLIVSGILVQKHFAEEASEFCNFGENFDCGIVNKSPYAKLDGIFYLLAVDFELPVPIPNIPIPISAVGGVVFLFTMFVVWKLYKGEGVFGLEKKKVLTYLRWLYIFNMVFALYLVAIEHYILQTWCVFCLALDAIMLVTLILLYKIKGDKL